MAVWPSDSIRTKNWGTEILTDSDLETQLDLLHAYFQAALNATTGHTHDGSANNGPKLTPANLVIASQAQGDVLYASSATAWARLGAGTSGQFLKTQGAAANPVWAVPGTPTHFRDGLTCVQASSTTITVAAGEVNIGGTTVAKTTATTLTIGTAGDWAGGSSLRTTSAFAYIGIDASGNIKMHTTAPTHDNYGVSTTAGKKRYATWEGTVYRIIGWFYMNATGSGELTSYEVGNIKDGNVWNSVISTATATQSNVGTSYTTIDNSTIHFYSSGQPINLHANFTVSPDLGVGSLTHAWNRAASTLTASEKIASSGAVSAYHEEWVNDFQEQPAQGALTYLFEAKGDANTFDVKNRSFRITEL